MATIKAGTYVFNETIDVSSLTNRTQLDFNFVATVGSIGEANYTSIRYALGSLYYDATDVWMQSAWAFDEARTITVETDQTVDDGAFYDWFVASTVKKAEAKFVRLICEDEVENPTEIEYGIITACADFIGVSYVTGVYATIDGTEKTLFEADGYNSNNHNFALYSTPTQIRVSYSFTPNSGNVKVYALSASYGVREAEPVTYSGDSVIFEMEGYSSNGWAKSFFFHSSELD